MAEADPKFEEEEKAPKKKSRAGRIVAIVVGVLLVGVGFFSFFDSPQINDALIEVGAGQTVKNMVEEYPGTKEWAAKVADVLEAAIEARTTSPTRLSELIRCAVGDASVPGLQGLLEAIIAQINATYKSSQTEQEYVDKLRHLVTGIRDGIGSANPPDVT